MCSGHGSDPRGDPPDILWPALASPLNLDFDLPAIASPDHEISAAVARRSFDNRALQCRRKNPLPALFYSIIFSTLPVEYGYNYK